MPTTVAGDDVDVADNDEEDEYSSSLILLLRSRVVVVGVSADADKLFRDGEFEELPPRAFLLIRGEVEMS